MGIFKLCILLCGALIPVAQLTIAESVGQEYHAIDEWLKTNGASDDVTKSLADLRSHYSKIFRFSVEQHIAWQQLFELTELKCNYNGLNNIKRIISDSEYNLEKSRDSPLLKLIGHFIEEHNTKCHRLYREQLSNQLRNFKDTHNELQELATTLCKVKDPRILEQAKYLALCRRMNRIAPIEALSDNLLTHIEKQVELFKKLQPKLVNPKGVWQISRRVYMEYFASIKRKCELYALKVDDILTRIDGDIVQRELPLGASSEPREALLARDFCKRFAVYSHDELFDAMKSREKFWIDRLVEREAPKVLSDENVKNLNQEKLDSILKIVN